MTEVSPASSAQMLPFTISPALIRSLLESEATTLIRAVAEAIMNAVDVGATRIDVRTVQDDWFQVKQLVIQDDGRGMGSREEIATHFQTLGFDHRSEAEKALGRTYGTFGLGRMQLFRGMRVDVALKSDARMSGSSFLKEFRLHFAFLPVLLFLNKVEVRETGFPWTHQSEDGDYLLDGRASLALYNVGVLVGQVGTQVLGSGGVINTRPRSYYPYILYLGVIQYEKDSLFRCKKA